MHEKVLRQDGISSLQNIKQIGNGRGPSDPGLGSDTQLRCSDSPLCHWLLKNKINDLGRIRSV